MRRHPEKPTRQRDQIDMLWDGVFNHLPTKIKWIDVKVNFLMAFVALILALMGIMVYGIFTA